MDDLQIIDLFFARDEQAIAQTEAKYGKLCLTLAGNILGNPQDAEECVNDTYLQLWNQIPPTRPQNFKAFLCKIARNLSLKRLEYRNAAKRSAQMTLPLPDDAPPLPDIGAPSVADEAALAALISDFLRAEPQISRLVFLRKYWFFDTVADIAARYSISESRVKSMLHRTRGRLMAHLKKEGFEP
ncbi:MAG: RNA polymerase sigma factor [Clostridia bacterium]|nr:RNA polymerase sigma factor [Clostridia bacterium]